MFELLVLVAHHRGVDADAVLADARYDDAYCRRIVVPHPACLLRSARPRRGASGSPGLFADELREIVCDVTAQLRAKDEPPERVLVAITERVKKALPSALDRETADQLVADVVRCCVERYYRAD